MPKLASKNMNYNKVIIAGRVTSDPQLRTTPGGQSVTTIGVATNRTWTDKAGQKEEHTEFHNVVIWGRQAEVAGQYLTKGATVLIEGRLQTRSWTDKRGIVRKSTEIMCEQLQLGQRPTPGEKVVQTGDDEPVINLEDEEIKPEYIPF